MERIIENATCYELKSGISVERQEHCDFWYNESKNFVAGGTAIVLNNKLFFTPFTFSGTDSFSDDIVRYSYDYGKTWEKA